LTLFPSNALAAKLHQPDIINAFDANRFPIAEPSAGAVVHPIEAIDAQIALQMQKEGKWQQIPVQRGTPARSDLIQVTWMTSKNCGENRRVP
jgi:hypothetical protein